MKLPLWIRALGSLPFSVLYALAAVLSFLLRYVLRYRVGVARDNLQRCFPELDGARIKSLLNRYYRRLGQVAVECFKLAAIPADELRRRVRISNLELLQDELDAGRSVILAAAHLGNWEWQPQAVCLQIKGARFVAAYKPLHQAAADQTLLSLRCRFGAHMVPAKKFLRVVARGRKELHVFALMADQIPASSGGRHWVRFFGHDTAFYPGPSEIARMTGYMTLFVQMIRRGRGQYEMSFRLLTSAGEQVEPQVFSARYAQMLEDQIRLDPTGWMWTHRRWKLAPPALALEGEPTTPQL